MFLSSLVNRGSLPVLEQVMSFTEQRHEVLADNVANFDTVGHKMRDLPTSEFFEALNEAVKRRDTRGAGAALTPKDTRHYNWDSRGRLEIKPSQLEDNNILFHDRNNRSVEKQMSAMTQNAMLHNTVVELLRQQYGLLEMAISGRV